YIGDYPKFFKMDTLSKLGFLLTELLVEGETDRFVPREDRAVVVCSRCGCVCNDRHYQASTKEFPSPALFVYTLPNIVTGEIAIRNKYEGETSAFVLDKFDRETFDSLVETLFQDRTTRSAVCCWIDCRDDGDWDATGFLFEK
ncbi:MAG: hypothetical protein II963_08045, partial [Bacteroidales bacterium]|nr:hypothetical protein [Bacteroidales bacterium]